MLNQKAIECLQCPVAASLSKRVNELEEEVAGLQMGQPPAVVMTKEPVPREMAVWLLDHWRRNGLDDAWLIDHLLGLKPAPRSMQMRYETVSKARA